MESRKGLRALVNCRSIASGKGYPEGNWRPWTIRPPFLIFFIFVCVILGLVIELLLRLSEREGGLAFGNPVGIDEELPPGAVAVFKYLPTIFSVFFGLLWSLAQHDYKRLEPFFQLSTAGGVSAENSLLLDYPYKYMVAIPFVAMKRRHWVVFYSTVMSLLIYFFLVPVASGIFEETSTIISTETGIPRATQVTGENLFLVQGQSFAISTEFSYLAYSRAWLNTSLPNFTTDEYTVLPFHDNATNGVRKNEKWVGETVLYEADLRCEKAQIIPKSYGFNITNGKDCSWLFVDKAPKDPDLATRELMDYLNSHSVEITNSMFDEKLRRLNYVFGSPWNSLFMGHATNTKEGGLRDEGDYYSLSSPMAECANSHIFLGIWAGKGESNAYILPKQWTATFCEPTYWAQSVKATVQKRGVDRVIEHVERLGDRNPLENFNSTGFEGIAATGWASPLPADLDSQNKLVSLGYLPPWLPDPDYRLGEQLGRYFVNSSKSVTKSVSNVGLLNSKSLAGLALYRQRSETLTSLLDPEELEKAYRDAYKLLFSFAMASQLKDLDISGSVPVTVTRTFEAKIFVVNNLWARASEIGLGVIAILTICLLVSTRRRICNLDGEPNSLLESMLAIDRSLAEDMHNSEYQEPDVVRRLLKTRPCRYRLRLVDGQGPVIEKVAGEDPSHPWESWSPTMGEIDDEDLEYFRPKPSSIEFGLAAGIFYFAFFGILLGLLTFLYFYDKKHNGLPTVALANSLGYKILFSYIPTILGMGIEPLWVVLGSYACIVGPYEILNMASRRRGEGVSSSTALTLDYDKTPPHFQLFQSLRTRNFVLGVLTVSILLSDFLAVAFSGMFSRSSREVAVNKESHRFRAPIIAHNLTTSTADEIYYVLAANLSHGSPLPEWTAPDMYILPFNITGAETNATSREATTWGIGASISCSLTPQKLLVQNITEGPVLVYHVGVNDPCWTDDMVSSRYPGIQDVVLSLHRSYDWQDNRNPSTDFLLPSPECPGKFFIGWGERPGDPQPANLTDPYLSWHDYVVLTCSARTIAAEVLVSVDETNTVLSYETVRSLSPSETDKFFNLGTADPAADFQTSFLKVINKKQSWKTIAEQDWENHMIPWINNLMVSKEPQVRRQLTNVTHIPDTAHVVKTFEDVYKSLFAIYLKLHAEDFFELGETQRGEGRTTIIEERVELSTIIFGIAGGVLALFLLVLTYVYFMRPGRGLSHLPTSLAATHTLLYASNIRDDYFRLGGKSPNERAAKLEGLGNSYAYGSFRGWDHRRHFGIYKEST